MTTTDPPTLTLLDAMFHAPLGAVSKRWPTTIHAINMGAIVEGWRRGTFTAACGQSGLRLVGSLDHPALLFPPRLKGMPDCLSRCKPCYNATGKKRPRTEFVQHVDGDDTE